MWMDGRGRERGREGGTPDHFFHGREQMCLLSESTETYTGRRGKREALASHVWLLGGGGGGGSSPIHTSDALERR